MDIVGKVRNVLRRVCQSYGTRGAKSSLWNREFASGRWDCLNRTGGDCIYPYIEKYANRASVLDLGCGSGSTGNEMAESAYRDYTGVDISDVALAMAQKRTAENRRTGKNRYVQSDIFKYAPTQQFDVILFRDSIYYVPWGKIGAMLDRYSNNLKESGVFIVKMFGKEQYQKITDTIDGKFAVVDQALFDEGQTLVLVFRPKSDARSRKR